MYASIRWIKTHAINLNLFESELSRSNNFHLRTSIISTRIYMILLTLIIISLTMYTSLISQTYRITVNDVSLTSYEKLSKQYLTALSCPCRHAAIPYNKFLIILPEYHPICSSVFVSDAWIKYVFNPNLSYFLPMDFRSLANTHFQILAALCSFSMRLINETMIDYLSDIHISTTILDSQSFDMRNEALSIFFQTSITNEIRHTLRLVRNNIEDNEMLPALQTSTMNVLHNFFADYVLVSQNTVKFLDVDGQLCECNWKRTCSSPSGFFDQFAQDTGGVYALQTPSKANVTGFVAGCSAIESLLESTLECFFDQICLENILQFFPSASFSISPLKSANNSQYMPKSSIETLVNQLFVERWSTISSFPAYFSQCLPISCTYTFSNRNNVLVIYTTLFGFYGGLVIVLRFCVPRVVKWFRARKLVSNEPADNRDLSLYERFQLGLQWVKVQIREYNLFKTAEICQDPFKLRTSVIATRIYLLLLALFVIILMVYTKASARFQTFIVYNPTETTFEYLYDNYASILHCPCTQMNILHGSFVSISPQYHPVCSSLFISESWITFISTKDLNSKYSVYQDFRVAGVTFFNVLATFCSLIQTTVANAEFIFNQSTFVTLEVLSKSELKARTSITLNQFQSNTVANFKRTLTLNQLHTRTMFPASQIVTVMGTPQTLQSTTPINFYPVTYPLEGCSCLLNENCLYPIYFYVYNANGDAFVKFEIPNLWVGCFTTQGVLASSLECFFNQTCLNVIISEIAPNSSMIIPPLYANATQYSPKTLIGTFINELVEEWNDNIDYTRYYVQCAPKLCSYTILVQNNILYVITTLVALFGGISIVLRFIVPILIQLIRERIRPRDNEQTTEGPRLSLAHRVRIIVNFLVSQIRQLNMFKDELTMQDDFRRRQQIYATRIYIVLLVFCISIIIVHEILSTEVQHINIHNPSQITFEYLESNTQYSSTLECPCQKLTISYNSMMTIIPYIHQVCSSDFISTSKWINLLYNYLAAYRYPYDDFRVFVVPQFNLLASLCRLANETLTDELTVFNSKTFLTTQAQSRNTILLQTSTILTQFRLSIAQRFIRSLDFIRQMAQSNFIVSIIMSNWNFHSLINVDGAVLWSEPRMYGSENCSCGTSAMCVTQAVFNGWNVPGFKVGCYPLEALFRSTLECLYNVTCVDRLKNMYTTNNKTIQILNSNISFPNITVQSLLESLMVDRWETNVSYDNYYSQCAPLSCTYLHTKKPPNVAYIVSIIIGLYGGLATILKLFASLLSRLGQKILNYQRQRAVIPAVVNVPLYE